MDGFQTAGAFEAGSIPAADWPLCQVRLQDDARYPWLILLPRRAGVIELEDLAGPDLALLAVEMVEAGRLARRLGEIAGRPVEKLNMAALGNVTPQLHIHVIGRRSDDAAWPGAVWGQGEAEPWPAGLRNALRAAIADWRKA